MLLRNKIREHGFTQLQVQEQLEWGRSYISQLLTKQKSLRVEQVLLILDVIGVEPAAFYGELYRFGAADPAIAGQGEEYGRSLPGQPPFNASKVAQNGAIPYDELDGVRAELIRSRDTLENLLSLLEEKKVLAAEEVARLREDLEPSDFRGGH
ncbi:MAG: helix-turn-helix transcriptional regulator [Acidobacteriota bacterium]